MCQLVLFVVPVLERYKDAEVVCSSNNAHACSGELGTELIVASRGHAFLGAIHIKGGDGRVVGGLFGEVGDGHGFCVASNTVGAARGRRGRCLEGRVGVLYLPVTLQGRVSGKRRYAEGATYPEELAQRRVVRLAWLALDIFLAQSQHLSPRRSASSIPDPW